MSKLTKLFEPINLGSLELPNRIVWPAITTHYDTHYDMKGEERSAYFYANVANLWPTRERVIRGARESAARAGSARGNWGTRGLSFPH